MASKIKPTLEQNLKTVLVDIVGVQQIANPDSLKPQFSYWYVQGKFSIMNHRKYANWSFTKMVRPYKFTWEKDYSVKTVIVLYDGSQSFTIDPTSKMQDGIDFEKTEPRKIALKDAQDLKAKGAYVFKIDADGNFDTIAVRVL